MHAFNDRVGFPGDLVEHLAALVALVRRVHDDSAGAYERAARELRIDPSVLRRRVQTLSTWLGAPLFEGRGRGLCLSREGGRVHERALAVLRAIERLHAGPSREDERLFIGCTGTVTTEVLPSALTAVKRARAQADIRIRRAGSEACKTLVVAGEIDVGFVRSDSAPRGFSARRICDDRVWLAIPSSHALARRRRVTASDLAAVPVVSFGAASYTRRRVMRVLAPLGARVSVEVEGTAAALQYARMGFGATYLSLVATQAVDARDLVLRDVTPLFGPGAFWAIWRASKKPRGTLALLLAELEA